MIKICVNLVKLFIINVSQNELIIVHVYKYDVNLARIMFFANVVVAFLKM